MASFQNKDGLVIIKDLIKTIQDNRQYLSEIDGAIGDGDHGINMNKGFTMCADKIRDKEMNLTLGLKTLGRTLLTDIGGSMGPLYGSFFIEMSKAAGENESVDAALLGGMLDAAYSGIKKLGEAKVGDKTLVDTLDPAVAAYKLALEEGKGFAEALTGLKAAAVKGRDSTIDLVAKVGRASRLGERSKGVLDAGATSCCLILCSMADSISLLIGNKSI